MQPINLLYVITKLELGGAQKQLLSLITNLDRERYNLSLITARDGFLVESALSIQQLTLVRSKFLERSINPVKDFLVFCQIYNFIRKHKIDIVHTHSSKAGILGRWAARLAGTKYIVHTVHGWSFNDYQNPFWSKLVIWLERLAALITHRLIVVSDRDLQKGLVNRIGCKDKYKLIRYGIDYQAFSQKNEDLRKELKLNPTDLLVGMVACFKPQKSPQDFIMLAYLVNQVMPETKFLLIGDGVLRRKIEFLIAKFHLEAKVFLTGWREDIPRVLSAVDIFVLTSLWEGLPVSVLEAMAASQPVVATDTGGIAEVVIREKTGFLLSPGDIKGMAEKLIRLLKDENLRKRLGHDARDSLRDNFTIENMLRNTENLYGNLCNSMQ